MTIQWRAAGNRRAKPRSGIESLLTGRPLPSPRDDAERIQLRAVRSFAGGYGRTEDAVAAMLANVRACVVRSKRRHARPTVVA